MPRYNTNRIHVPSSPEELEKAEAWFKKNTKLAQDPDVERVLAPTLVAPVTAPAPTEPRCSFCTRPIFPEFAYVRPTPENKGMCKRKDCKEHRAAEKKAAHDADPLACNPDLDEDTDVFEDGDAVDDFVRSQRPKEEESQPSIEALNTGQEEGNDTETEEENDRAEEAEEAEEVVPEDDRAEEAEDYEVVAPLRQPFGFPGERLDTDRLKELLNKPGFVEERRKPHKLVPIRNTYNVQDRRALREKVLEIENKPYLRQYIGKEITKDETETTDELELLKREAAKIEKDRLEKEEKAKRRIVKKRRPRPPVPVETPSLRSQNKLSTRQVASVLDDPLFNKPFQVKDRSLLYDRSTTFWRWYAQLAKDSEQRGVPIWEARRRGDSRYEKEVTVQEFVMPEICVIDGVMVSLDTKPFEETLPDGTKKLHVVQRFDMPNKIKPRAAVRPTTQKSPSTYGDLLNVLPYRWEVMVTPEERSFYKDYAAGNLSSYQLDKKHGERTPEDVLLLENRILRHAFSLRLLDRWWASPCALNKYEEAYNDDEARRLDIIMISKSCGAYIGGGIRASRMDRYGRLTKLDSFETRPLRDTRGGKSDFDNGGPEYDDYGEESGS